MLNILSELDNNFILSGVVIALVTGVVSGLLYCMFNRNVSHQSINLNTGQNLHLKKKKKIDEKRSKKRKTKSAVNIERTVDPHAYKAETSESSTDEVRYENAKGAQYTPSISLSSSCEQVNEKYANANGNEIDQPEFCIIPLESQIVSSDQYKDSSIIEDDSTGVTSQQGVESSGLNKSKKSKRRSGKKLMAKSNSEEDTVDNTKGSTLISNPNVQSETDLVDELRKNMSFLEEQLRITKSKLDQSFEDVKKASQESDIWKLKEEKSSLGLRVVQEQYTELLKNNKTLEYQIKLLEANLKSVQSENSDLVKRLDQANNETMKVKKETELEFEKHKKELSESASKISAMAAALAVPQAPKDLSSDLFHATELAQAMSKENCILKSRLEHSEVELNQLHQTNIRQQQELQAFRKLHTDKEAAFEELCIKREAEKAETNTRLVTYETQLKQRCHELELEKQRNQDYVNRLSETTSELTKLMEREQRQSQLIASLEYQFAELNADKQRMLDDVARLKQSSDVSNSEFRAQIATLTNNLNQVSSERDDLQQTISELKKELEEVRKAEQRIQHQQNLSNNKEIKSDGDQLNEKLRSKMHQDELKIKNLENVAQNSTSLYEKAVMELDYYKNVLINTEGVLAELQAFTESLEIAPTKTTEDSNDVVKLEDVPTENCSAPDLSNVVKDMPTKSKKNEKKSKRKQNAKNLKREASNMNAAMPDDSESKPIAPVEKLIERTDSDNLHCPLSKPIGRKHKQLDTKTNANSKEVNMDSDFDAILVRNTDLQIQ